jgi:hypothetical protein
MFREMVVSKKKAKLSLCLTNLALHHEGVWGSGGIDAHIPDLCILGNEWSASRLGCFTPGERAGGIGWIGGWVGLRIGLDDVQRTKM